MIQSRNDEQPAESSLTARSVLASTLLGTRPPRLPVGHLVRAGALFGIAEGTVRTALSRMAAAGEVRGEDGWYRLTGQLVDRQRRQDDSRAAARLPWPGTWWMAVVREGRRPAAERAGLRAAAAALRFAELREAVWLRPANLDPDRLPTALETLTAQCHRFEVTAVDGQLRAADLWDLDAWAQRARHLQARLDHLVGRLEAGDTGALPSGFVLSADVLRHFQADPLLPDELLPTDWPGAALRHHYDRYDGAFRTLLRRWFATGPTETFGG